MNSGARRCMIRLITRYLHENGDISQIMAMKWLFLNFTEFTLIYKMTVLKLVLDSIAGTVPTVTDSYEISYHLPNLKSLTCTKRLFVDKYWNIRSLFISGIVTRSLSNCRAAKKPYILVRGLLWILSISITCSRVEGVVWLMGETLPSHLQVEFQASSAICRSVATIKKHQIKNKICYIKVSLFWVHLFYDSLLNYTKTNR